MRDQRNELDIETMGEAFRRAPEEHSAKNQKGEGPTLVRKREKPQEDVEVRRGGALDNDKCRKH
jgi:hypothetical protein